MIKGFLYILICDIRFYSFIYYLDIFNPCITPAVRILCSFIFSLFVRKSATQIFLLQYLVRTPVPHGGDRHADDGPRPRQVRVHRVSEYVEGIISRDATG